MVWRVQVGELARGDFRHDQVKHDLADGPILLAGLPAPLPLGEAFDLTGSYQSVFLVFSAAYVLAAVCFFFARRPSASFGHSL